MNLVKILCVTWKFVQGGGVTGFIINYFRHIDSSRIHMDFLVLSEGNAQSVLTEVKNRKSKVFCIPILSTKNLMRNLVSLRCFFRNHKNEYQIVHSHFFQLDWLLFALAKKNGSKVCISHAHATKWSDYQFRAMRNRIMALPVPYSADIWGACSIAAGEFLYGKKFSTSPKQWVIHNAIEVKKFEFNADVRAIKRQEVGYTDEIVLGNVGRMASQKNQMFLLDIIKSLIDVGQQKFRLLIVGDGELCDSLTEKANHLGVSKYVTFTGTRTDIPELLWAMDIFLLPSHYEGLPVSGIEAQAAGLPCIFSDQITKEAGIANATYLPIDKGPSVWCKEIIGIKKEKIIREEAASKIVSAGYDIDHEAISLVQHYTELIKDNT